MGKKKVRVINPSKLETISYKQLIPFQGDLKNPITPDALEKMRKSILKNGIFVPKMAWFDKSGKANILDGHQTRAALESLESDGYEIPKIPFVRVEAKDERDAAEKLLQLNSRYANINPDTHWFQDLGIQGDDLEALLGAVEIPGIEWNFSDEDVPNDNKDIDEDDMSNTENECPKCGFKW